MAIMSYLEDNARTGRILLPDLVRAFALFGIVLVNVAYFAYPGEVTYHAGGLATGLDKAAYFAVNSLFLFKSYTLFSFMFGVGLAYQMSAAARHGANFGSTYFRRMFGLILLGVLHVTLAFLGDILIIYGLLGMVLFLFRKAGQKALIITGLVLVVVQIGIAALLALVLYLGETFSPQEMAAAMAEIQVSMTKAGSIYPQGGFAEIAARRWSEWLGYIGFAMPIQAPGVFGFFLLGLAGVKAGILSDPAAPIWRTARRIYLPIGLLLSMVGAAIYISGPNPISSTGLLGYTVILLAAPFSSLGYIGLIAKWSQGPMTALKSFVARGGTASLTAYLMQSLILSLVFCGYGLGYYQKIDAFGCVMIAAATGLFTISFASLWRTRFKRGPLEVLLRKWTYFGKR